MEERRLRRTAEAPVVTDADMLTAFGDGVSACREGLMGGATRIAPLTRFATAAFTSHVAATVPGLDPSADDSLVLQMFRRLAGRVAGRIPPDAYPILATTVGEVDLLERSVLGGSSRPAGASHPRRLLAELRALFGLQKDGVVVSAACASSSAALAYAGELVDSGSQECVLVLACDSVTEFVFSGFSALMALAPEPARPFDRSRRGLSVGEAAAVAVVAAPARASRERREPLAVLSGWGLSNDANHMTGPSRDGAGLAQAVGCALSRAAIGPGAVGAICAHGTGTTYNDAMEMKAFRSVFAAGPVPTISIKGAVGHTLGAAGLVEAITAIGSLASGRLPPSIGLSDVDPEADGWVHSHPVDIPPGSAILSTNSGFGGVNAALVFERPTGSGGEC